MGRLKLIGMTLSNEVSQRSGIHLSEEEVNYTVSQLIKNETTNVNTINWEEDLNVYGNIVDFVKDVLNYEIDNSLLDKIKQGNTTKEERVVLTEQLLKEYNAVILTRGIVIQLGSIEPK